MNAWANSKSSPCCSRCALGDHTYAVPVQRYVEDATGRNVSIGAVYAAHGTARSQSFLRSSMGDATARRGGKSKRLYAVTPLGLKTARELHRVRDRIWHAIAEGKQS